MRSRTIAVVAAIILGCQLLAPGTAAAAPADTYDVRCNHGRWIRTSDYLWVFLPVNTGLDPQTSCTLRNGHNDNFGVVALQNMLVKCYGQAIAVDGDFGPATEQALKRAQAWEFTVNAKWQVATNGVYNWSATGAYVMWPYHLRSDEPDRFDCRYKTR
ncbi:peptidoglycan-binding domain-containing protein [Virgisporangium aurantiacum]|uniref:Peptidoglycan binding-like domain-containing protein n=1 Tax=Virgisporangium aurantiacum TaxID=175570 RepID=A0A8J4E0C5_9ACTN|nr:peptidoglycan-binding domain-containing protein [Virgisporangium aurantiacum]GIJ56844.1 hypothetical protein Vau01_043600 [Virgisporangium aurantiacum]